METEQTETAEAQSLETPAEVQGEETQSQTKTNVESAKPETPKKGGEAKEVATLKKLLARQKEDPNVKFSDAELDILEKYDFGEKLPKIEERKPETEPKDEAEEESEAESDEEAKEESQSDPVIETLMKEVGAKKPEEILAKIKGLKSLTGSRDAQAVAKLSQEIDTHKKAISSQNQLLSDAKAGNANALAFLEKNFGLRLAPVNGQQSQKELPSLIDADKFIDKDSGEMVNAVLASFKQQLESVTAELKAEKERNRSESARQQAENHVVDEIVKVAQNFETLKAIPNLREAVSNWNKGKPDERLEILNELFDIAQEIGSNLETAFLVKRGREADKLIAQAREGGKKEAYSHKPNPSLSGAQGGKGESTKWNNLTDAQIDAMAEDYKLMPDDWFDSKTGHPIQDKIPKRAWRIFGFANKAVSVA